MRAMCYWVGVAWIPFGLRAARQVFRAEHVFHDNHFVAFSETFVAFDDHGVARPEIGGDDAGIHAVMTQHFDFVSFDETVVGGIDVVGAILKEDGIALDVSP